MKMESSTTGTLKISRGTPGAQSWQKTAEAAHMSTTFMRILLLVVCLLPLGADGNGDNKLIPANWTPSLSAIEGACKAELETKDGRAPSQQELNDASNRLTEVYDAQLFVVYVQLLQVLKSPQRQQLFHEQKQWLRERERKATAAVQSKGGSLAALEYSGAFGDLTQKRIAEFHGRTRQQVDKIKHNQP